jgi:hypothetical protein
MSISPEATPYLLTLHHQNTIDQPTKQQVRQKERTTSCSFPCLTAGGRRGTALGSPDRLHTSQCCRNSPAWLARCSFALLGQLLEEAFVAEPLPFDETWLQYDAPPHLSEETDNARAFSVLQHMICYQIADLHRMAEANLLENKLRFFGIDSPTGYTWYNFDPSGYLGCAIGGIRENGVATDADWIDLAVLLWLGQIYE